MEVSGLTRRIVIREPADAVEARQQAAGAAARARLDEVGASRVSIIASELASNLLKHTSEGGELLVNTFVPPDGTGAVEVLATDRGPGIANPAAAFEDGYSTAGSLGTGLGGIRRLSSHFEVHSTREHGTAVLARVDGNGAGPSGARLDVGIVTVARDGEDVSGDGWAIREFADTSQVLVVDGLGHGLLAAEAATAAVATFRRTDSHAPADVLRALHPPLRPTRGATAAVMSIDRARARVTYGGVGNIAAAIVRRAGTRWLVSINGTLGREPVQFRQFEAEWDPDALLIAHSDGLNSRWRMDDEPRLARRDPALIAAVLFRDFRRELDDVTVLVARERPRATARGAVEAAG